MENCSMSARLIYLYFRESVLISAKIKRKQQENGLLDVVSYSVTNYNIFKAQWHLHSSLLQNKKGAPTGVISPLLKAT